MPGRSPGSRRRQWPTTIPARDGALKKNSSIREISGRLRAIVVLFQITFGVSLTRFPGDNLREQF